MPQQRNRWRLRNAQGDIVDPTSPEGIALTAVVATEHNVVNPVSTDASGDPVTDSAGSPAVNLVVSDKPSSQTWHNRCCCSVHRPSP